MDLIQRARELRAMIETLSATLDDEKALEVPELFPQWSADNTYNQGDRVRYSGVLYKCLQGHEAQTTWNPMDTPGLFARILPGQDGTEIGEWVQPDSTNTYMKGDRVYYPDKNGKIYESLYDYNSHSPEEWPAGWQVIE